MTDEGTPAPGGGSAPACQAAPPAFDATVAHQARIYDYWLGGKDNYEADRKAGDAVTALDPNSALAARANRAFLGRAVRHLAGEAGIRQFLDIGTGIPTANNTHEVAQSVAPDSRIVYVDYDPVVLAHARALLTSSPEGATDYLDADLRDTGSILAQAARTLDFSRPVAVMLIAVMHVIRDEDDPGGIVAELLRAMPPGSYLALSHIASDIDAETMAEAVRRLNHLSHQQFIARNRTAVARFFDGLELVDPGVAQVQDWRPDPLDRAGHRSPMWCGVAVKR